LEVGHALLPLNPSHIANSMHFFCSDNPESDIAGANAAGWNSILVHTGVYSPESGPPAHLPTIQARDVEEAVTMAISREAEPN
jgi:ribonucleotide monophosphatase NagD (HAD superfamily)